MAGEGEKEEGKSFKVEDRRRFSPETGEPREGTAKVDPSEGLGEKTAREGPSEPKRATDESIPEINFSTFVISLSTQALMHLGEIPNPLSGKMESDIPVAKQMIDIIGVLREKTRGNLDSGEEKLMDDVLFDLRMRYVEAVKRK
ncbi:MAG: DUF1844 domain-containing protein [Candidatus Binatia bacterium]